MGQYAHCSGDIKLHKQNLVTSQSACLESLDIGLTEENSCVLAQRVSTGVFHLDLYYPRVSVAPSGWGGTSPTSPTVDNGTAAWGKPSDAPTGWGDPDDAGEKTTGWGNPSPNPIKSG